MHQITISIDCGDNKCGGCTHWKKYPLSVVCEVLGKCLIVKRGRPLRCPECIAADKEGDQ